MVNKTFNNLGSHVATQLALYSLASFCKQISSSYQHSVLNCMICICTDCNYSAVVTFVAIGIAIMASHKRANELAIATILQTCGN